MLLFLVDLINIEKFRISFSLFYSFSFILRSRATSSFLEEQSSPFTSKVQLFISLRYIQICSVIIRFFFKKKKKGKKTKSCLSIMRM